MGKVFENLIAPERIQQDHADERRSDLVEPKPYEPLSDYLAEEVIEKTIEADKIANGFQWVVDHRKESVVDAFARLTLELREDIDLYDTIIGDDESGRLPTLFLEALMNGRRSQKEKARTYFLASGQHRQEEILQAMNRFVVEKNMNWDGY